MGPPQPAGSEGHNQRKLIFKLTKDRAHILPCLSEFARPFWNIRHMNSVLYEFWVPRITWLRPNLDVFQQSCHPCESEGCSLLQVRFLFTSSASDSRDLGPGSHGKGSPWVVLLGEWYEILTWPLGYHLGSSRDMKAECHVPACECLLVGLRMDPRISCILFKCSLLSPAHSPPE